MKSKRNQLNLDDFSGGLLTNPNQIVDKQEEMKFTPACLNVYAEGKTLRRREGITKINSSSAGTMANGLYNWVLNASQQYLIGLFDSTLKQMPVVGTTWGGTWTAISKDSANGTAFSNSIMHFVTYQGTLIMTTENRDKPQRITTTDTSYKNLDFGGTGIAPLAKYPQVWKEHVFLLNVGAGGQLTENCTSLSAWTTIDVNTGATTTAAFTGVSTFRLFAGATSGDHAAAKVVVSGMTTAYSAEIKTYFDALDTVAHGDYAFLDICNGTVRFRTRWSQDGLECFDGTTWNGVGVASVNTGVWITWKYLITAGTATAAKVDVFKNGSAIGLQFSVANASTASNGQINIQANAAASTTRADWHMDYLYINSIVSKKDYITNGSYETAFVGGLPPNWNIYPTQPYLHFKCNDSASNSTVTDNGTGTNNGTSNNTAGTINTSVISVAGKISNAFEFGGTTNKRFIKLAGATVSAISADSVGTLACWFNATSLESNIISFSNSTADSYMTVAFNNSKLSLFLINNGSVQISYVGSTTLATATWYHVGVVQSGGIILYLNGAAETLTKTIDTTPAAWISTIGSADSGRLADLLSSGTEVQFFSGKVDDYRIYRTAITSTEMASIYAEGSGVESLPVITQNTNTAFIKMGTASLQVANAGSYQIQTQTLTSGTAIAGISSIIGTWVYFTNNATYKIQVNDGTNTYSSAVLTANGTWQYQTLTFTPVSNLGTVMAQVIGLSAGTMYVDQTALITSSTDVTNDFSDRLQRSASGTYDTWTGLDSGSNDITTPGDVGLTGSFILQDRMYVTKAWNIYRVTYTASVPLLDIKQARSVVGTKSPRATKNIDYAGVGELVIFLGTDRNLYLFDGFSSTPLSDGIQLNNGIAAVYTDNINTQALDKIFAVNHSDLGWYEIFLPIGNATVPNYSLVYNYRTKSFWPFDNRNFTCGNVSDDGSGQRVIMVSGATNGITYQLNSGTSDDGTAINSYWTSFKIGISYILSKIDEIDLATDSVSATPVFSWRADYETAYIAKTLKASTNKHNFDPARVDNLIQFKVSDNSTSSTFKIWHIKCLERGIGIGT